MEAQRQAELQAARLVIAGMGVVSLHEAGLVVRLWSVRTTGARVMMGEDECSIICPGSHVLMRHPGIVNPRESPPS